MHTTAATMQFKIIGITLSLVFLGCGVTMLYFGISWELDYKKGYDGTTTGKITNITPVNNVCDVSYMYDVNNQTYIGVSRRDCVFSLVTKLVIQYRVNMSSCSRISSGMSADAGNSKKSNIPFP